MTESDIFFNKLFHSVVALLLSCGLSTQLHAETRVQGLSYSPDHWPKRWSSTIRQQQNGHSYPTRQFKQAPPPALPETGSGVSEQDLFYSPSIQNRFGRRDADRLQRFDDQLSNYHKFRDASREARKATYAYHGMPALQPGSNLNAFTGFPYGTTPLGIDPVLGHPGIGIPILPGVPYGYPFVGHPYGGIPYLGSPLGVGAWNPPFGVW